MLRQTLGPRSGSGRGHQAARRCSRALPGHVCARVSGCMDAGWMHALDVLDGLLTLCFVDRRVRWRKVIRHGVPSAGLREDGEIALKTY